MKVARFFAVIFAVIGVVLMLGTAVISFVSIDSTVKILENPDGAMACSEELLRCVNEGDYASMENVLYGSPSLNADGTSANVYSAMLWDAFRENMTMSYNGKLYLLDAELARDGVITVPDVAAITRSMQPKAQALLQQRLASQADPESLYDADGNVRGDVVDQVLQEALRQALEENSAFLTKNITVKLVRRDDRWWAVPDQAFLKAISGLGM